MPAPYCRKHASFGTRAPHGPAMATPCRVTPNIPCKLLASSVSPISLQPFARKQSSSRPSMHALMEKYRHHWQQIGLSEAEIERRCLPLYAEATELKTAEHSPDGRELLLTPAAASAWKRMKAAASADGAEIHIVSAYRSVERQVQLIAGKLAGNQTLDAVLQILAPPGCSEHHTGRAIDIATGNVRPLDPEFVTTQAFDWLVKHAAAFGFTLSFPENNPFGYVYEPWHWCYGESGFGKAGS